MVRAVGKDPEHLHKGTCPQCSSKLEYTLSEVTYSYVRDYGGGGDDYNYIICPVCNPDGELKTKYGSIGGRVEVKGR